MHPKDILQNVRRYRKLLEAHGVAKRAWTDRATCPSNEEDVLAHAHALLDGIEQDARRAFQEQSWGRGDGGSLARAACQLGQVQHALWSAGYRTLADLDADNGRET